MPIFLKKKPESFIRVLELITQNDIRLINQLAVLFARISLEKDPNPFLNLVYTNIPGAIALFLMKFFEENIVSHYNIQDTKNIKSLSEMISDKVQGGMLNISFKKQMLTEEMVKNYQRVLKGKPIKLKDAVVGNLTFISNFRYIHLVTTQKEIDDYIKKFPKLLNIIEIKNDSADEKLVELINEIVFSDVDFQWINWIFTAYGLNLLCNPNKKEKKKITLTNDAIIKKFLIDCCLVEENKDCYAKDIYSVFCDYFNKRFQDTPMKRVHLVDILKELGFKYCRLRKSAKDNLWGFKGVGIDVEKFQLALKVEKVVDEKEKSVEKYLNYMLSEVKPILNLETEGDKVLKNLKAILRSMDMKEYIKV